MNYIGDIDAWIQVIDFRNDKKRQHEVCDRTVALNNLYREAVIEANRLKSGKDEIGLISASVRNIFELMLIIRYLASSDDAVKSWIGQIQKDALDIHDGLISLFKKHGMRNIELETSRENVLENGNTHGVSPCNPFRIKSIAEELGFAQDYDAMYKLCSKIVHPSSIRVNLYGVFDKNDDYKNSLIHIGIYYLAQIAESSERDIS